MNQIAQKYVELSMAWLKTDVLPLWIKEGIDPANGGFEESLSAQGRPTRQSRRAMVQARQIYSFTEAYKLQLLPKDQVVKIIENGVQFLIKNYSLSTGAFIHSVSVEEKPDASQSELYTQAFVLFALARAYEILKTDSLKRTAFALLNYLETERRNSHGGFTEIKDGKTVYQSNPHMHLFEALIEWMRVDQSPIWKQSATAIYRLCETKMIDPISGALAEYFDEKWIPLRENGRIIFEPGHQYEWAWLLVHFEKLTKIHVGLLPEKLYAIAEKYGVNQKSGLAYDEMWNDFSVKKASSRFWPQCERIKTAVELGLRAAPELQPEFARAADQAMTGLHTYFTKTVKGLWFDTQLENGEFTKADVKSSSLYHIINAISEYVQKRPQLRD